jgi:hypothetical protein
VNTLLLFGLYSLVVPRQRRFQADLKLVNDVLTKLIREANDNRTAADLEDLQNMDYAKCDPPFIKLNKRFMSPFQEDTQQQFRHA